MSDFCRCDNPNLLLDGVTCETCGFAQRRFDHIPLHPDPPPFSRVPAPPITHPAPWTTCPGCGCGPGVEHDKACPRAAWNNETYRARRLT